MGMELFKYMRE